MSTMIFKNGLVLDKSFRFVKTDVEVKDGKIVTAGGRVLGVTAVGDDLKQALAKAYDAVGHIHFYAAHYRKDIGTVKR